MVYGCEDTSLNRNIPNLLGHVYVECYIDKKWILIDPFAQGTLLKFLFHPLHLIS